jgi:DNA-directed RNA polymerase specialized sigma24 family protein
MATRVVDDERWEGLTQEELSSTDPGVVVRIQNLLRAAQGRPRQNRAESVQRKAELTLRNLTLNVILINCSRRLSLPRDHHDVTSLADRIYASHASGTPFLRDARYKTWLEIWDPDRGPFMGLVSVTARSRCQDWLASLGRDPHAKYGRSLEAPQAGTSLDIEPSRPDDEAEFAQVDRLLPAVINRISSKKAREAIRARVCHRKSAAEYAQEVGIEKNTANMLMKRGAIALARLLVQDGLVGEGFGRNIISVGKLTRTVLASFRPRKTLKDCWKDPEDGRS